MKRVLLTGATGFIGRNCIPLLLKRGYEVHAVSSKPPSHNTADVTWHQADLLDARQNAELMAKVRATHLLHCAWYAVPGKYWTSLENFRWVQASLSLLQGFITHGGERVVMAGTCAEYDWQYECYSENVTPLAPSTLYGTCKNSLQAMLNVFSRQAGLSSAWGRVFFLYGPHEYPDRLVASVIGSLLKGQPALCSSGEQVRDFLHVEDVASAFVAILESQIQGPVNIGSGIPTPLKEVISLIGEKIGCPEMVHLRARPVAPNDPPVLLADVHLLQKKIGWSPYYNMQTGIDQTIQWWRKNLESQANV